METIDDEQVQYRASYQLANQIKLLFFQWDKWLGVGPLVNNREDHTRPNYVKVSAFIDNGQWNVDNDQLDQTAS